jgi:hypothetical protein
MKSTFLVMIILLFSNSTFSKDYGCDEINVQGQTYAVSSTDTSITVEEGNCSDDVDRALYGLIGAGILYWLVSSSTEDTDIQAFNDSNRIGIEYRFNNKFFVNLSTTKRLESSFNDLKTNSEDINLLTFKFGITF